MKKGLLLGLLLHCFLGLAQIPKSADSLKTFLKTQPKDTTYILALNDFAFEMVKSGNFEEAQKTIDQMQTLSSKLKYSAGFYKTENMRGVVEYSKQHPEKALDYFLKSVAVIKKYRLAKKLTQNALNNISIIYGDIGDREKATAYAIKLIDFQEKNGLNPLKTSPYDQIGKNLKFYKKYDEALAYFKKSLAIETGYKNLTGMAVSENNIGNVYDDLQQYITAAKHFENGLHYANKAKYKLLQCDLLINLARMYRNQKKFRAAESYLLQSETICQELKLTIPLKTVYQNLGDVYFYQSRFALAEINYLKSLEIAKTIKDPERLYLIYQALADLKEKTGDYKEALQYKISAEIQKDSTFKLETAQTTENLLRKYETKKKEQAITVLSKENTIKKLELENAARQRIVFIIGLTLLAVLLGSLYIIFRNKQKSARLLVQKNEEMQRLNQKLEIANTTKAKLFSIIGHDLRSPISHIYQFLDLQQNEPELFSAADKIRHNDRITEAASAVLETMEDLLIWSKSQMQQFSVMKEKVDIKETIDSIVGLMQTQIEKKNIILQIDIEPTITVTTDRNILTIMIRNLLQNAVKYTPENSTVVISAIATNQIVTITIADEGEGMPDHLKTIFEKSAAAINSDQSGLGLTLVKEMATLIGALVVFEGNFPRGTSVRVSLLQFQTAE